MNRPALILGGFMLAGFVLVLALCIMAAVETRDPRPTPPLSRDRMAACTV